MLQIKVFCFTSQIADMFFVQVADRHLRDVLFATIRKPNSFPLMNVWMAIQDWLWPILDHFWAPWKKVWHFIRCKQAFLIKPLSKKWLRCKRNYSKSILFEKYVCLTSWFRFKVHIFWESHKILRNLHVTFYWHFLGKRWRFRKILWPFRIYKL